MYRVEHLNKPHLDQKPNVLGGFIKMKRQSLGMSQKTLSARLGYKDQGTTVCNMETGKVRPTEMKLKLLALALCVGFGSLKELLDLDSEILNRRARAKAGLAS